MTTILAQRLPVTFELLLYAFVISLLIAIPVATFAARKPGGIFDSITTFIAHRSGCRSRLTSWRCC